MLHTSGSLAVRTASVESTCLFLRKTNDSSVLNKHSAALFYSPNQEVRMAMQSEFECLLDDDGFRHIDVQTQRRRERHGRTPGFKDSNLRPDSMMKTETMSTPRRRLQDATLVESADLVCTHGGLDMCTETLVELRYRYRNRNRNILGNGNRQLPVLTVNIETDAQTD